MTQNNILNPVLPGPGIKNQERKSSAKVADKSNDTFMDILDGKMKANAYRERNRTQVHREAAIAEKAVSIVGTEKPGKTTGCGKEEASKTEDRKNASKAKAVSEDKTSQETDKKVKEENAEAVLEALLALLQEILAKLEALAAQQNGIMPDVDQDLNPEQMTEGIPTPVPASEFLESLLSGNSEELYALLEKTDVDLSSELKALMDNLKSLAGQTAEDRADSGLPFKLSFMLEKAEGSGEELINQLRAQCGQVIERLNRQIAELDQSLPGPVEDQKFTAVQDTLNPENAEASGQTDAGPAKSERKKSEPAAGPYHAGKSYAPVNGELEAKDELDAKGDTDAISSAYAMPDVKVQQGTTAAKPEETAHFLPQDPAAQNVTDQVLVKVKLMAGENKQEMEMQLKPESFGKLSLKIIHDRGEVLAKITAENEQVKGILESNMGLLRDALEKSGLSVQSLSVSVGGEEKNQFKQHADESKETAAGQSVESGDLLVQADTLYDRARTTEDYYGLNSQINLKA